MLKKSWILIALAAAPSAQQAERYTELHARLGWQDLTSQHSVWEPKDRWSQVRGGGLSLVPGAGDILGPVVGADLELDFSFSVAAGGNSGLKYRVPAEGDDRRAPEFQIVDEPDLAAHHRTGALYGVLPSLVESEREAHGRVVARGAHIYHEVDGVPSARGTVGTGAWNELVAASKFRDIQARFATPAPGRILLQDHGSPVRFGHLFHRDLGALPGERLELKRGETLDGWKLVGDAQYEPTPYGIRGTVTSGARNAFLTTERTFGDFRLEFGVMLEDAGNSGIQIRSAIDGERLRGLQVEIDPSERAWSGGLYDESRRGWLASLADDDAGRASMQPGQWNHFEIECVGPWIRTWINNVPLVDHLDALDLEGHIALQVHSGTNTSLTWRGLVLHDLGRHAWIAADDAFWDGGLWSSKPHGDGSMRLRFAELPESLLLKLGVTRRDGADPTALVIRLADHLAGLGAPVAGHELELDVMRYGDRVSVTWGGRPLFQDNEQRELPASGFFSLSGVKPSALLSTEILVAVD